MSYVSAEASAYLSQLQQGYLHVERILEVVHRQTAIFSKTQSSNPSVIDVAFAFWRGVSEKCRQMLQIQEDIVRIGSSFIGRNSNSNLRGVRHLPPTVEPQCTSDDKLMISNVESPRFTVDPAASLFTGVRARVIGSPVVHLAMPKKSKPKTTPSAPAQSQVKLQMQNFHYLELANRKSKPPIQKQLQKQIIGPPPMDDPNRNDITEVSTMLAPKNPPPLKPSTPISSTASITAVEILGDIERKNNLQRLLLDHTNGTVQTLVAFLFPFDLRANITMIVQQIRQVSLIEMCGEFYLMFYCYYYPDKEPFKGPDNRVYAGNPQAMKSVLVAAKINPDSKGAVITYGFSIENKLEQVLNAQSFPLFDVSQQNQLLPSACYLTTMIHVPDPGQPPVIALQIYNSTAKKSRILITSKVQISFTKSFFQMLKLNRGRDLLVIFQKSKVEFKVILAPADAQTFHLYFPPSPVLSIPGEMPGADIRDFSIDSQLKADSLTITTAPYATNDFQIALLMQKSNPSEDRRDPLTQFYLSLVSFKIESPAVSGTAASLITTCESLVWKPHIECSQFELHQKVQKLVSKDWIIQIEPAKVRFCSELDFVFVFGTAQATSPSSKDRKVENYLFVVAFTLAHPDKAMTAIKSREIKDLVFDMGELKLPKSDPRHNKLMPPVDQKFMIAENPGLRRPTGVMTTGPQKHPLFIAGIQNDDTIFSVYLDDPTGAKTLRVENARDYFEKESPDKNVVNKKYHHVTSISWAETPHGDKFTMAANRFSVITFGLNSSQGTLNV